jgi:hypothetical protein
MQQLKKVRRQDGNPVMSDKVELCEVVGCDRAKAVKYAHCAFCGFFDVAQTREQSADAARI